MMNAEYIYKHTHIHIYIFICARTYYMYNNFSNLTFNIQYIIAKKKHRRKRKIIILKSNFLFHFRKSNTFFLYFIFIFF